MADPERLAIVGLLARGAASGTELAGALDLSIHRIRRHLTRLSSAGVVRVGADRHTYALDLEGLRDAAREAGPPREAGLALGAIDEDEEAVLRTYFRAGRLTEIPAKRSKRLVILTRLALEFEPGIRFSEAEVNETLTRFHDDYAALRRYLVDDGLMSRDHGVYWRSGGPVDI
jgi:biotin operon repressor